MTFLPINESPTVNVWMTAKPPQVLLHSQGRWIQYANSPVSTTLRQHIVHVGDCNRTFAGSNHAPAEVRPLSKASNPQLLRAPHWSSPLSPSLYCVYIYDVKVRKLISPLWDSNVSFCAAPLPHCSALCSTVALYKYNLSWVTNCTFNWSLQYVKLYQLSNRPFCWLQSEQK